MVSSTNDDKNATTATTTTPLVLLPWWWYMVVMPIYGLIRIAMANRMPIMDCDEVYNYWEPLSFLMLGHGQQTWEYAHDYALRTYAYIVPLQIWAKVVLERLVLPPLLVLQSSSSSSSSSSLSLSSWKFFTNHAVVGINSESSSSSSVAMFVLLRASLAAAMAAAELFWLSSLPRLHSSSGGGNNGRALAFVMFTATFLLVAPGMNHAAASYLPSTTWMMTWLVCSALFLRVQHYAFCTVAIVATLCIGWPFGVATVVPMAIRILFKEYYHQSHHHDTAVANASSAAAASATRIGRVVRLLAFSTIVTIVIQVAVLLVDYQYYKRWTSATYNIFAYNAAGGGDELYGVEPASYYVKNLLLNLTLLAPLAIPALPLLVLTKLLYPTAKITSTTTTTTTREKEEQQRRLLEETNNNWWDLVSILSSFYLWLFILVPRPHKEERFLFPIYPVVCLAAVVTCDTVIQWTATRLLEQPSQKSATLRTTTTAPQLAATAALIVAARALLISAAVLFIVLPVIVLSVSRTAALHKYYTAPLHIYATLAVSTTPPLSTPSSTTARVCTCGEWYRFPSSFFLTSSNKNNNNNLQLGYLPSSFGGQLPQDFSVHGSGPQSRAVLQPFNDQNKHQPERFVTNYQQDCLWIVDLQDELLDENDNDSSRDRSSSSSNSGDLCQTLTRGNDASSFELVASVPFLDASRTISSLHRVLYIPYFHERAVERGQVSYQRYVLYKKKQNDLQ